ncbi:MAG: HDOD domain-containing protein [Myxococcaceae bacterium]|jgi:HD-like signal output (HDOD) protein|nr:HDOD domain-containing protein [Myxococcaceae bacterium]
MIPPGASDPDSVQWAHEIDDDDVPSVEQEEALLTAWLDEFLAKPTVELPRLPSVALEILEVSRRPNARIEDLGALLEREPVLAAKVLKLANSALYGAPMAVTTLKQALIRMGLATVREVVMEAAYQMTVMRAEGFNDTLEAVRRHSTATAWLSRFVARNTSMEAENAFLIGLLHDLGLTVGLIGLSEWLKKNKQPVRLRPEHWLAVERQHHVIGGRLLDSWKLPPALTLVTKNHHQLMMGGHPHPSVAILMVAEHIAYGAGWGVTPTVYQSADDLPLMSGITTVSDDTRDKALSALSLSPRHYEQFVQDTRRVLETLAGQFQKKAA